jgi:vanillate O-demethylase ferredoxin subunit
MYQVEAKRLAVRVSKIRDEAIDIKSFDLAGIDGQPLPAFIPGSHIDVHVGGGIVRQYSLCNGPAAGQGAPDHYLIAVKKEAASRGGSLAMHQQVKEGDVLQISTPRNNFELRQEAGKHVLVGGGIGITPLLSMARHLLASGADFEIHYFSRSVRHTAFHALLSAPEFKGRAAFHYAIEPDSIKAYLRNLLRERPQDGHLYLCGPGPFMDAVQDAAAATWPPQVVHLEYFAADPAVLSGPQAAFEVVLAYSGGTYTIPEGETIVEVLARNGIQIDVSCEQGVCGTCLTGVLEGTPDHKDMYLDDEERKACNKMTPCVSRSLSPKLVLDL